MSEGTLRVVSRPLIEVGITKVLFEGSREECYEFMAKARDPAKKYSLLYPTGRESSWVL